MFPMRETKSTNFVFSLLGDQIFQDHPSTLHGVMCKVKGSIVEFNFPNEYPIISLRDTCLLLGKLLS